MKTPSIVCSLFFFILFFVAPLFAEVAAEGTIAPEEAIEEAIVSTEEASEGVVTGEVFSLDMASKAITVKTPDGLENTFFVIDEETILWRGIDDIELSDITIGEDVEVGYYTDEDNKLIASWIDVLVEEESVPLEVGPETEEEDSPEVNPEG